MVCDTIKILFENGCEKMATLTGYELNRKLEYMMEMRPVLRKSALFCDGTSDYREPMEPMPGDTVTIRFRTGKDNVDIVWLCLEGTKLKMEKYETEYAFDYYRIQIRVEDAPVRYRSERASCRERVWYLV